MYVPVVEFIKILLVILHNTLHIRIKDIYK